MSEPRHQSFPGSPPTSWGQPSGGPPPGRGSSRMVLVLVVVVALVVAGGALGLFISGGDSRDDEGSNPRDVVLSPEEQDFASAIASSVSRDVVMDDTMAQCVSAATVQMVGVDALRDAATLDQLRYGTFDSLREFGVTVEEPRVAELARHFDECGDWVGVLIATWAQAEATPQTLECLGDNATEEQLSYLTAASFVGTQELSDSVERTADEIIGLCVPGAGGLGG
jgi:hypothetical protein